MDDIPRELPYAVTPFTFRILRAKVSGAEDMVCLVFDRQDSRNVLHMPKESAVKLAQALLTQAELMGAIVQARPLTLGPGILTGAQIAQLQDGRLSQYPKPGRPAG